MAAVAPLGVIGAIALSACSGSSAHRQVATGPSPIAPTISGASPSPSQDPSALVLKAWSAEHAAYADALKHLDPQLPALLVTAVDPVLTNVSGVIAVAKKQGLVAKGDQDLGTPKVISIDATSAVVESCVHDQLLLVDAKTGKPAPGIAGKPSWSFEHTTLKDVAGVGWVVSDNDIKQSTKRSICDGH